MSAYLPVPVSVFHLFVYFVPLQKAISGYTYICVLLMVHYDYNRIFAVTFQNGVGLYSVSLQAEQTYYPNTIKCSSSSYVLNYCATITTSVSPLLVLLLPPPLWIVL